MANRYLACWVTLFMGLSSGIAAQGAIPQPSPAQSGVAVYAGWRGQDRDDARRRRGRRWRGDDDRDRGRRFRFRDDDRRSVHIWYEHHRDHEPRGFRRRDWLAPEYESRLRVGFVLDPDMRRMAYPVPDDLRYELPPCPRHYRYVVIGGHICLVDRNYMVQDLIHAEFNFR